MGWEPADADAPDAVAGVPRWVRLVDVVMLAAVVAAGLAWWRISGPGDYEARVLAWLVLGAYIAWNQGLRPRALLRATMPSGDGA